jgi:uncharacterized protein
MLQVSELFIYPIKSLGGISLSSALVTDRGFQYDRRWMLIDSNNQFMTQREVAEMALLKVEVEKNELKVTHKEKGDSIAIPFEANGETITVQVWSDRVKGKVVDKKSDDWFSDMLSTPCRLVHMPDQTQRRVDGRYSHNKEITSFSDGYPFLVIGQSSLDDLNNRVAEKLPINRFRPNIVFTGGKPYEEDTLVHFTINDIHFYGVKLCSRCVITTINQDTIKKSKEPLRTLSKYRMKNNKIYFGQNLLHQGEGFITVGDELKPIEGKAPRF